MGQITINKNNKSIIQSPSFQEHFGIFLLIHLILKTISKLFCITLIIVISHYNDLFQNALINLFYFKCSSKHANIC